MQKLTELVGDKMTVGEVLALALVGPTNFMAGPLAILIDKIAACNLIDFYAYLIWW